MKKLVTLALLCSSTVGFCQTMHLSPDTKLPIRVISPTNRLLKATDVNSKAFVNASSDTLATNKSANTVNTKTGAPLTFTTKYNATVLNTNFTLPLLRVNFLVNKPTNATNSLASTSFFNSAGAGISYSNGEMDVITDGDNNTVSVDYHNHFGFQAGFLFASNSTAGATTSQTGSSTPQPGTIFALCAGVSILNFQLGAGYELGGLAVGQRRGFLTIAYAIPMSVLIDGGYKVLKMSAMNK